MFCCKCGEEINDQAIVCPKCGCATQNYISNDTNAKSKKASNGLAIAGFVCSFFSPILGWIFGGIGLSRAKKRNGKNKNFSIAALAIASGMAIINFVYIIKILTLI